MYDGVAIRAATPTNYGNTDIASVCTTGMQGGEEAQVTWHTVALHSIAEKVEAKDDL